jgi:hypothetical protein
MKKNIVIAIASVLLFQTSPAAKPAQKVKSFTEWCLQKDTVPAATQKNDRRTIRKS